MGLPPSASGAVHETVAVASPTIAETAEGALGTVNGVTELEASEAALEPAALAAVTVKVYAVPLVSPLAVAEVGTAPPAAGADTVTLTGSVAAEATAGVPLTV